MLRIVLVSIIFFGFWFIAAGTGLIFLGIFFKIKMIIQDWRKKKKKNNVATFIVF
jgi:hypothetical protein